jgi:hypothetical protein
LKEWKIEGRRKIDMGYLRMEDRGMGENGNRLSKNRGMGIPHPSPLGK